MSKLSKSTVVKLTKEDGVEKVVVQKRKSDTGDDDKQPGTNVDDDSDSGGSLNKRFKTTEKEASKKNLDGAKDLPTYFHLIVTHEDSESTSYYAPLALPSVARVKDAIRKLTPILDAKGYPFPSVQFATALACRLDTRYVNAEDDDYRVVIKNVHGRDAKWFIDDEPCKGVEMDLRILIPDDEVPLWKSDGKIFSSSDVPEHLAQTFLLDGWC